MTSIMVSFFRNSKDRFSALFFFKIHELFRKMFNFQALTKIPILVECRKRFGDSEIRDAISLDYIYTLGHTA